MPENLKTPGVYIAEKDSGANAVVQVSSAVPVFIGYTERASINGKSFHMKPVQINSLSEYEIFFGGAPKPVFTVKKTDRANSDVNIDGTDYQLEQSPNSQFYLYNSLKLFFDNGGSDCYIISIGQYGEDPDNLKIDPDQFKQAIDLLEGEEMPTMLLMPDSLLLNEEDSSYYSVQTYALQHCAEHMDKVALFDIYGANAEQPLGTDKNKYVTRFRENIG
jgi:phage tail sheath protein FI